MAKTEKISRKSRTLRQIPKTDPEYRQRVEWLQDAHARNFAAHFLYPNLKQSARQNKLWQKANLKEVAGRLKYIWEFTNAEFEQLEKAKVAYLEEEQNRLKNL